MVRDGVADQIEIGQTGRSEIGDLRGVVVRVVSVDRVPARSRRYQVDVLSQLNDVDVGHRHL